MRRCTCIRPDWSRHGIGYFLLQQHCGCTSGIPDCCSGGWRITLAGSRFLSSAEQHYAAIEGEALAVAWGLEQTQYFTQGCDNLVVVTDHKPPSNTRARLMLMTLSWQVCCWSVSPSMHKTVSCIRTVSWFHRPFVEGSFSTSMPPTKELRLWSCMPMP